MDLNRHADIENMDVDWDQVNALSHGSIQTFSASLVISELLRLGVQDFIVSPGARCVPLALALNHYKYELKAKINLLLVNDERAAGFLAQGIGKQGRLACLVCTSGTAVANYLPAVIEAFYSKTPLLVITADRPWELLNAGANQTINQKSIFKDFCVLTLDLPAPEKEVNVHSLLANIDQVFFSTMTKKLPAHLNLAYRKPFYDDGFSPDESLCSRDKQIFSKWWPSKKPYQKYSCSTLSEVERVSPKKANSSLKVMLAIGPMLDDILISKISEAAISNNIPVIADINSNFRQIKNLNVLSLSNLYLDKNIEENCLPELVYHVGGRLISDTFHKFLQINQIDLIQVKSEVERADAIENEFIYPKEIISIEEFLRRLSEVVPCSGEFSNFYSTLEQNSRSKLDFNLAQEGQSERSAVSVAVSTAPANTHIFLSASLVLREADNFVYKLSEKVKLFANRGATGIDGIISSSIGTVLGTKAPLLCILGDQAALHDLSSYSLVNKLENSMVFLLINNGGGAIFNLMKKKELRDTLINPHATDYSGIVKSFGLAYYLATSLQSLEAAISDAYSRNEKVVIEYKTDGVESVKKLSTL